MSLVNRRRPVARNQSKKSNSLRRPRLEFLESRHMLTGMPTIELEMDLPGLQESGDTDVVVWLSEMAQQAVSVTLEIRDGLGDLASDDWEVASTSISIPAGQDYAIWTAETIDDLLVEGTEGFQFQLVNPLYGELGPEQSQDVTLTDNDNGLWLEWATSYLYEDVSTFSDLVLTTETGVCTGIWTATGTDDQGRAFDLLVEMPLVSGTSTIDLNIAGLPSDYGHWTGTGGADPLWRPWVSDDFPMHSQDTLSDGVWKAVFTAAPAPPQVDLVAHRPLTEGPDYNQPFPKIRVRDSFDETPGVGIRKNGDTEAAENENDLIEVDILTTPQAINGKWVLKRSSLSINAFQTKQRGGQIFAGDSLEADVTGLATSANPELWIEWAGATGYTNATLTLDLIERTLPISAQLLDSDSIVFRPFTSIVAVFGGWPNVPLNPEDGAFNIARRLYSGATNEHAGYDVHAYRWSEVAAEGVNGHAFQEVLSAVRDRGIMQIGMLGYSKGAGASYVVSDLLKNNITTDPIPIDFTGYIDAIEYSIADVFDPQLESPIDSNLNVHYRQELQNPPSGEPTPGVNVNVTATPWGGALRHQTIDNDRTVADRMLHGLWDQPTAEEPLHPGLINHLVP